ncbi:MAG TPA: ATP-binding protein [Allosphingosinicella sp.]|nr:ATP-binding protein [Allosphingosinicella sp.]
MTTKIDLGFAAGGDAALLDLEELLATRLLVQGNSGSGKSHLLRRLLEESAGLVQQVVVDPEGDFVTLADAFGHVALDAALHSLDEIARIAGRIRRHRASVVLNLEGLDIEGQMLCAAAFLGGLFEAPREHWYPALVVVDEAQLFAPASGGEVSEEARRASLGAMTNLMCRGRKRGLAGIVATQRLAKLAKNVAAEASNFLMGRTFLDIDMLRAADLLGMERRQAEAIRDLERGEFLALGPALSKRAISVRIGPVRTAGKSANASLLPLPAAEGDLKGLLLSTGAEEDTPLPAPRAAERMPPREPMKPLQPSIVPPAELPPLDPEEEQAILAELLADVAADAPPGQPLTSAFQDFQVRCRMRGVRAPADLARFRRDFAMARAGIVPGAEWEEALALAAALPEEMLAPFLAIARAARASEPCPSDEALARLYGTSSTSRARWVLSTIEEKGLVVSRVDLAGRRTIGLPHLGWQTAPAVADPSRPTRLSRIASREAARGQVGSRR